ncbi:MAG: hypothetical protein M3N54_14485 [Acidobacteriota bacterium]|nr:hypothetical protein [Acidobacteriota bacterium]
MKPLLFVAADPRECIPWVGHWDESHPLALPVHWARGGKWNGRPVLAIANGAGARRAAAAVASVPTPSAICSIGFCGALDQSFVIGDIFTATEVRNGSRSFPASDPHGPEAKTGVLVSNELIVQTAAEKKKLRENGCATVEMEAAAVARASEELSVPFYCIRAVSDLANEDFANDFNASLMPDGRFSVSRLILRAFGSPVKRFGELIRLSRRTSMASKNLGDFLAACSF